MSESETDRDGRFYLLVFLFFSPSAAAAHSNTKIQLATWYEALEQQVACQSYVKVSAHCQAAARVKIRWAKLQEMDQPQLHQEWEVGCQDRLLLAS